MRSTLALLFSIHGVVLTGLPAVAAETAAAPPPAYKVVSEDAGPARRVLAVRIDGRLTDAEIRAVAEAARARARGGAARTQVNLYLPAARLTDTPWATAVFAPDLKISVLGLSREEEDVFVAETRKDTRKLVGAWLTGAPAIPGRLAIYREKNKLFAEWRTRGGQVSVDEVVESRGYRGHRFDIPGDDSQHYVVLPGGQLELRDKTNVIAVAERIWLAGERSKLAQRGLGAAGALAAKRAQAEAALVAARSRKPAGAQAAVAVAPVPTPVAAPAANVAVAPASDTVVVAATPVTASGGAPAAADAGAPVAGLDADGADKGKALKAARYHARHRSVIAAKVAKKKAVTASWF